MDVFKFWVKCFNGTIVNSSFIVGPTSVYCHIKLMCDCWELTLYFLFFLFSSNFSSLTGPHHFMHYLSFRHEICIQDMKPNKYASKIWSQTNIFWSEWKSEVRDKSYNNWVWVMRFELWKLSYEWYSNQTPINLNFMSILRMKTIFC